MDFVPLLAGAAVAALVLVTGLRAGATFPADALAVAAALLALGALSALQELAGWDALRPAPIVSEAVAPEGSNILGYLNLYGPGDPEPVPTALFALPLALGAAFAGLLGDVLDGRATRLLPAAGTLALALATFADHSQNAGEYLLAVAVVTLSTHAFSLLDPRPGRSLAAFVLLGAGLLAIGQDTEPVRAIGVFAGPFLVLGAHDLCGRALLGALAGLWLVLALSATGELIALALLIALVAYGEARRARPTGGSRRDPL